MDIGEWREAVFEARPNRFLAEVRLDGRRELAHVPDPGRLQELLIPGIRVRLRRASGTTRRTAWTMIGAKCPAGWVNIDSRLPNLLFAEALGDGGPAGFEGTRSWKAEYRYGRSVLDFRLEPEEEQAPPCLVEVKGCTLVVEGIALFPDAPTARGARHVEELIQAKREGFRACLVFVIKHPSPQVFRPNRETDPHFASTLAEAAAAGVEVLAYHAPWREDGIRLEKRLPAEV